MYEYPPGQKPPQWPIDSGVVSDNASKKGLPMPVAAYVIWEGSGGKIYDLSGGINKPLIFVDSPVWVPGGIYLDGVDDGLTVNDDYLCIEYANANTIPSVDNPTLPMCMAASNTSNTSDIVLQSASMMGAVEGKVLDIGILNNITAEDTATGTDETPIFSIHNYTVYQSKINRVRIKFQIFTASIDAVTANKPATIRVRLNPTLTGASFSAVDANTSVVHTDTSATAVSGGTIVFSQIITEGAAPIIDFSTLTNKLNPGDTITVSLESSSGNVDSVISMNWIELF